MSSTDVGRGHRRSATACVAALALLAAPAPPSSGQPAPDGHAASTSYGPLSRVGVTARSARTDGRNVALRITLAAPARITLAVADAAKATQIARRSLLAGTYELRVTAKRRLRGRSLALVITAAAGEVTGRGT